MQHTTIPDHVPTDWTRRVRCYVCGWWEEERFAETFETHCCDDCRAAGHQPERFRVCEGCWLAVLLLQCGDPEQLRRLDELVTRTDWLDPEPEAA